MRKWIMYLLVFGLIGVGFMLAWIYFVGNFPPKASPRAHQVMHFPYDKMINLSIGKV